MKSITAIIRFNQQDQNDFKINDLVVNYKFAARQCVKGQIKLVAVFKHHCYLTPQQQAVFDQIIVDNTDRSINDVIGNIINQTTSRYIVLFDSHTYVARDYFKAAIKYLNTHNSCRLLTPCITSIRDYKLGDLVTAVGDNGVPVINRNNAVGKMLIEYDFIRGALFPNGIVVDRELFICQYINEPPFDRFSELYIAYAMMELITAHGNGIWTKPNHFAHNAAIGGNDFKIFIERYIDDYWDRYANEQLNASGSFYKFFNNIERLGKMFDTYKPKHDNDHVARDYENSIALAKLTYNDFCNLKSHAINDQIRHIMHNINHVDDDALLQQVKQLIE